MPWTEVTSPPESWARVDQPGLFDAEIFDFAIFDTEIEEWTALTPPPSAWAPVD